MTTETIETQQTNVAVTDRRRMSYEEWLAWDYESSLTEWINGEVIIMSPPTVMHQKLLTFLGALLQFFVEAMAFGRVLVAPVGMRLSAFEAVREPDIIFVATAHLDRFSKRLLEGPADLVVEIISEDSVQRDRSDKFYEYQAGGVREYWIIDPREGYQRVDLFVLDETNRYQPVPPERDGIYRSVVLPGFWLREEWLWQEDINVLTVLGQMVGVERLIDAIRGQ